MYLLIDYGLKEPSLLLLLAELSQKKTGWQFFQTFGGNFDF